MHIDNVERARALVRQIRAVDSTLVEIATGDSKLFWLIRASRALVSICSNNTAREIENVPAQYLQAGLRQYAVDLRREAREIGLDVNSAARPDRS